MMPLPRLAGAFVVALVLIAPSGASAQRARRVIEEPWYFTLDAMFGGAVSEPAIDQFDVGGGGSVGVYRSFIPGLAMGLRVGAGALSAGRTVPQDPVDRGVLDWGQLSASVRIRPLELDSMDTRPRASGFWLEAGAGPWLVEGWVDPVFDAGIGYGFVAGPIVLGPVFRFTHVIELHDRYADEHLLMASGGMQFAWNDAAYETTVLEPAAKPDEEDLGIMRPVATERAATPTPPEPEVVQPFVNDQLVIDERVFFDFDRWELRPAGRQQLLEIARRYEESGDRWAALVISGHADRRGPEDYNVELSRKRADAVRTFLTARGIPTGILEIQAWGEARPEIPDAETEYEHQVNRRVQFEIVWAPGARPEGVAPHRSPPEPDYVDPAPPGRR